jgi:hypothetical protein
MQRSSPFLSLMGLSLFVVLLGGACGKGKTVEEVEASAVEASVVEVQPGTVPLPSGYGYEWTGTVYQQKKSEGKETFIFGLAGLPVLLFLAALYESWSIPFAVLLCDITNCSQSSMSIARWAGVGNRQ